MNNHWMLRVAITFAALMAVIVIATLMWRLTKPPAQLIGAHHVAIEWTDLARDDVQPELTANASSAVQSENVVSQPAVSDLAPKTASATTPPVSALPVSPDNSSASLVVTNAPDSPTAKPASQKIVKPSAQTDSGVTWAVQLASFTDKANAQRLVSRLEAAGFTAYTRTSNVEKASTMTRVFVGPWRDMAQAKEVLKKCRIKFALQGLVVQDKS